MMFALTVVAVWFMFMILPLAAATITINLQHNSLWVIYGLWIFSVLVCLGLIVRIKK
jgi:hypothetical protein